MAKAPSKSKASGAGSGANTAMLVAGGIGVLVGLFMLGKRGAQGMAGITGAIDRALGVPSNLPADGGDRAADLGLDQPHHGPDDRAGEHFRPDMAAAIPANDREAFAPATMPNPAKVEPSV